MTGTAAEMAMTDPSFEAKTYAKVDWRLIPFLFLFIPKNLGVMAKTGAR